MKAKMRKGVLASMVGAVCTLTAMVPQAWAAPGQDVAYYPAEWGYLGANLVTWDVAPGRALVLSTVGRHLGRYVADEKGRTITYDQAKVISNYSTYYDSCSQFVQTSYSSTRIRFKQSEGSVDMGKSLITADAQEVVEAGCDKGLVVWSSSVDDAGTYGYNHVLMSLRQGQADLKVGARIAGMKSGAVSDGNAAYMSPADIATLTKGRGLQFADVNQTFSYRVDAQGWWVLDLPNGQRAFTRLQTDAQGGQVWLMADVVNGKKQWVQKALMTSAKPSSKFGSVEVAARNWEAGFTVDDPDYGFFTRLRADGTGERGSLDRVTGEFFGAPLNSWSLQNGKVVQDIRVSGGDYKRYRTWQSVNKVGDVRWVLEDDSSVYPDGSPGPFVIFKRVHPQVDRGAPSASTLPSAMGAAKGSREQGAGQRLHLRRMSPL